MKIINKLHLYAIPISIHKLITLPHMWPTLKSATLRSILQNLLWRAETTWLRSSKTLRSTPCSWYVWQMTSVSFEKKSFTLWDDDGFARVQMEKVNAAPRTNKKNIVYIERNTRLKWCIRIFGVGSLFRMLQPSATLAGNVQMAESKWYHFCFESFFANDKKC